MKYKAFALFYVVLTINMAWSQTADEHISYTSLPGTFWVLDTDYPSPVLELQALFCDAYIFLPDNVLLIVTTVFNRDSYNVESPEFHKGQFEIFSIDWCVRYVIDDNEIRIDETTTGYLDGDFLYIGNSFITYRYRQEQAFFTFEENAFIKRLLLLGRNNRERLPEPPVKDAAADFERSR